MKNFLIATFIIVSASLAQAQNVNKLPTSQDVLKTKELAPVVKSGLREAQIQVHQQNVLEPDEAALNKAYNLEQLQQKAQEGTSQDPLIKQQQFSLGAEILPFVAPWINEISKECMKNANIEANAAKATEIAASCSQQAVAKFNENPTAFIDKLSQAERARLQELVNRRMRESQQPRKPASP